MKCHLLFKISWSKVWLLIFRPHFRVTSAHIKKPIKEYSCEVPYYYVLALVELVDYFNTAPYLLPQTFFLKIGDPLKFSVHTRYVRTHCYVHTSSLDFTSQCSMISTLFLVCVIGHYSLFLHDDFHPHSSFHYWTVIITLTKVGADVTGMRWKSSIMIIFTPNQFFHFMSFLHSRSGSVLTKNAWTVYIYLPGFVPVAYKWHFLRQNQYKMLMAKTFLRGKSLVLFWYWNKQGESLKGLKCIETIYNEF